MTDPPAGPPPTAAVRAVRESAKEHLAREHAAEEARLLRRPRQDSEPLRPVLSLTAVQNWLDGWDPPLPPAAPELPDPPYGPPIPIKTPATRNDFDAHICRTCGCLVPWDALDHHSRWHARGQQIPAAT